MNSHQQLRSSTSPTSSGMMMAAPCPSSANSTIVFTRGSLHRSSTPRRPSPLNAISWSPSPTPTLLPSSSLLSTPPPLRGRTFCSFAGRDPSPVRDALTPISRTTSAPSSTIPQPSPPVAVSSSSPAHSSQTSPEPEERTPTPTSTWWSHKPHTPRPWTEPSKRKRTVPPEQMEAYVHTRSVRHISKVWFLTFTHTSHTLKRAIDAVAGVLGAAAAIGHEVLFTGVDLLQYIPIPGLEIAAQTLLRIWDAVGMVEVSSNQALIWSHDTGVDVQFGR